MNIQSLIDEFSKLKLSERLRLQDDAIKSKSIYLVSKWTYFCLWNGFKKILDKKTLIKFLSSIRIEVK